MAANPYVNKVVYGNQTLIDLTNDDVTPEDVANGVYFHNASGERKMGTYVAPTVNNATLTIQKNGATVNTFTANSATNTTVNITVPTKASDINAQPAGTYITSDASRKITAGTAAPSGGSNGDIYIQYT